ncbi:hypothetical protein [Sandaracinus amylolyticus]|uniref:Lipoprotein n=1 Tax=Sandaracinus amylolyticus TaxID=927083 RepID=A0A0F6W509_9BACT|nr:hypothetical protein [Sandaracinus amylolyticus]AKF07592.1 hypothetical protein DB32_004741 [Sandaracinus amylolyticus]
MRRAIAALVLGTALVACGGDDDGESAPSVTRGPQRGGGVTTESAVAGGASEPARVMPDREAAAIRAQTRTPQAWGAGPQEVTETRTETTPGATPARDLGAELRSAIGTPTQCFDAQTARAMSGTVRIPVRAYVTTTGRITRSEVGGSAPERVRACIVDSVEALAMRGPVEGAPREVSTEIVLDVRADSAPTAVPSQAPEVPLQPGAVAPGITLPARGGDDPAPGFVPPSSTLPAVGPDEPAPGFVPPSSTLPARVY